MITTLTLDRSGSFVIMSYILCHTLHITLNELIGMKKNICQCHCQNKIFQYKNKTHKFYILKVKRVNSFIQLKFHKLFGWFCFFVGLFLAISFKFVLLINQSWASSSWLLLLCCVKYPRVQELMSSDNGTGWLIEYQARACARTDSVNDAAITVRKFNLFFVIEINKIFKE